MKNHVLIRKHKILKITGLSVLILAIVTACCYLFQPNGNVRNTYPVMEKTSVETEVIIIEGGAPGKTLFVVGGVHGDEIAGWKAAETLKKIRGLKSGTLIILSPANAAGSRDRVRNVEEYRDLNRSFPGEKNRDLTDRLAAAIFQEISVHSPDLVLDLHEAGREEGNRDFLGNSLIFSDTEEVGELIFELIADTENGSLCSSAFTLYGPAPTGSLNREVTARLHIPVITIETSREEPEDVRVQNHLDIIYNIMRRYSME